MSRKDLARPVILSTVLILALLFVGSPLIPASAQDISIQATLSTTFVYQGQLSDAGGPVNDTCDFTFKLYDALSGGSQINSTVTANGVTVTNGSFSTELDFGSDAFTGDARYLEITVNCGSGVTTLSPRQQLFAVPYALGLRPGATIEGAGAVLTGITTGQTNARGLVGKATATTGSTSGVRGETESTNSGAHGVYGLAISASATGTGVKGQNNGTTGYGVWGTAGNGTGVLGQSNSSSGYGVWAYNTGGIGLLAQGTSTLIEARNNSNQPVFRVLNTGAVQSDVSYTTPAADFAEMLPATSGLEAADVLVIGLDGKLTISTEAYQESVAGVYSTEPGFLGGAGVNADLTGQVPLAVVGIVPVKVSAENGAIQPGDMLVASDTPGHAMQAGTDAPNGTVIGKALSSLDDDLGVIQMLVILQ
ncbi:MAG: hypothetical protein AAF485_06505 [Chloroflexota bacterium]